MHAFVRSYFAGWQIREHDVELFRPYTVAIERYRFRGTRIPTPFVSVA